MGSNYRFNWCPRGYPRHNRPPYNNPPYNNPRYNNPRVDYSYNPQSEAHSPNYWNFNYTRSPNNTDDYNNFNRHPRFYCNRGQINSNNNFRRGAYNTNRQVIRSTPSNNREVVISNTSSPISLPIINADAKVSENPELKIENKIDDCAEKLENFEKNSGCHDVDYQEVDMEIDSDADTVVLDNYCNNLKSTSLLDGNIAVKKKNSDGNKIDSQLENELNVESINKFRQVLLRKISNTGSSKKPTRRKSIADGEFCEIGAVKRKVRSASIPSNPDLLSQIGPSSIITRSKSRQEVSSPPPTKTVATGKKQSKTKRINQDVSSVTLHDKLFIKKNIEMNMKTSTIEKDNQQTVDISELKRSKSTPHSSKFKSQDTKLRLGSSSKGEFSESNTSKIQAKRKRLEAIFGEDDFLPTEEAKTVTVPSIFAKAEFKKSSLKKLLATSETDSNMTSYKIKTPTTNNKIITLCKRNKDNVTVNLKALYTPSLYCDLENSQEENHKIDRTEKHAKKRKYERKSVKKLVFSEKQSKADDKTLQNNKLEKSENKNKRKRGKRSSKKEVSEIEENKEVFISIPEVETNQIEPLCIQIIPPPNVTDTTAPLNEVQIIDLDDFPDDHIHENPMGLLIKPESPLEDAHNDGKLSPHTTQDYDIFELLRGSNFTIEAKESEAAIVQTNVEEEVPCLSDRDYGDEYFPLEINECIADEIVQPSTRSHTPAQFQEVKYIVLETEADVKPIISKEPVIVVEDEDVTTEELEKINYSDFAAIFVDDFRYYNYVENSVCHFSIHPKSSTTAVDNQNKYSELFESRKLIFERISKTMYNYLKKHEILNFDCHKLIEEINNSCMTTWSTSISTYKILRFLHDIILTWRKPNNDFIKRFCNNISYNMLLSNEENDHPRRPNSTISSTSEPVVNNSVSTTQTVAAAQTTTEENQQVEQNLRANLSLISPRPIEQLLANPSICRNQSPLLSSSESQASNDIANISKQNPKTLNSSMQPHHTTNQSASNELSLPQSASKSSSLLPPTYEDFQENIKVLSRSSTVPLVHWTPTLMTPPTSTAQPPTAKKRCNKSRNLQNLSQNVPQTPKNLLRTPQTIPPQTPQTIPPQTTQTIPPQTSQCRIPVNNASLVDVHTPSHLSNIPKNLFQPANAMSVQQFTQDMSANTGSYPRYASQHSHNQPPTNQYAQSTFNGNLHTYHPRYSGMYHEQQSQSVTKNLANTNLHYGYNLENGTQLQQPLFQPPPNILQLQQIAQSPFERQQQVVQQQHQQAASLQAAQLQHQAHLSGYHQSAQLKLQLQRRHLQQQQQTVQLQKQQLTWPQHHSLLVKQLSKYPYDQQHQRPTEQPQQRLQNQLSNSSSVIRSTGVAECTSTSKTPDMERNVLGSGTCTNNSVQCNIPTIATESRNCTPPNHLVQNNVSVSGSGTNILQSSVSTSGGTTCESSNHVVHRNNVSASASRACTPPNNLAQSNVSAIEGETTIVVKTEVPRVMDDIDDCIIIEDDDSISDNDDKNLSSPTISSSLTTTTLRTEDVTFLQDNQKCICSNKATHICACKKAVYCSEDCQAKDWDKHKLICM